MPAVQRPCLTRGCPNLTTRTRCPVCERQWEQERRADPDLTGRRNRPTPSAIRVKVLYRDGFHCRRCGKPGRLEVHHVNGKRHDNRLINLMTLCVECHRVMDRALGVRR